MNAPSTQLEKHVVLVGAGNAHIQFVKRTGMYAVPGVAVTLISEASVIPYSAMVPGHIGGDYAWQEITIDLVRLCRSANVRFVAERVVRIDAAAQRVYFDSRPPLAYDVVSLGLGALAACPPEIADWEFSTLLRPLTTLIQKIEAWEQILLDRNAPFHLVVVGGGASGCELALAIQKRLGRYRGFRLTLLQGNARLLPQFPAKIEQLFGAAMQQRGIEVRVASRVSGGRIGSLQLDNGERLSCDAVLWATHAAAHPVVRQTGLTVDDGGFLVVKDTLQSVANPSVFGTGDCVAFESNPELPKNGVHAVRQGAVLFHNVSAFLRERPLRPFRPQRYCLALLNTADGQAVLSYGPVAWKSRAARVLKDRIDRKWIDKFTKFTPMSAAEDEVAAPSMRCGGCGSKISSDVLSTVLKRIECPADPRVLMGCQAGEDAAAYLMQPELYSGDFSPSRDSLPARPRRGVNAPEIERNAPAENSNRLLELQTVDYFKAFVDDPYLFGQIAALHSLSDLYAMNARPFAALAIATLPFARGPIQEQLLFELLAGATQTFREAGVILTGGHTTEGHELALGFSVSGHVEESRLFQKGRLSPGDSLILTKPLGTGALLAAWMRGECRAEWYDQLARSMLMSNAAGARVFSQVGVTACTDITGFGLAGHLFEMLDKGRASARIIVPKVPRLSGFDEVVAQGIVSTLQADNSKIACRIDGIAGLPAWLFDPQTSGGLIAAVRRDREDEAIRLLTDAGYSDAAVIGEVVAMAPGTAPMIHLHAGDEPAHRSAGSRLLLASGGTPTTK